jgi:IS30 family transposase
MIEEWRGLWANGEGKNFTEIAEQYGVHPTTVSRAIKREIR